MRVGDGAVVGSGAVVSRDVPGYAVEVGVPARVIGYRFDEATIEGLKRIRWWEWSGDVIRRYLEWFDDPARCVARCFSGPRGLGCHCLPATREREEDMRLVGIAMVKNEDDIIEAFVRHNLRLLDAIAILDNGSTDGTREILNSLGREGLPVSIIQYPELRYIQSESMTNLLRSVESIFRPDWVFPIDADEFLVEVGGMGLRAQLQMLPAKCVAQFPWRTYVPAEGDDPAEANPVRRLRHRRVQEPRQWYKVALPREVVRDPRVMIDQGNHSASLKGRKGRLPAQSLSGVELAHYPVRSGDQILGKTMVGWLAYLCDPARGQSQGYHWRDMYDRFLKDDAIGFRELKELGATYAGGSAETPLVEDPIEGPAEDLSYLAHRLGSPLQKVCSMAEDLARRLAAVTEGRSVVGADEKPPLVGGVSGPAELVRRACDVAPFHYLLERFQPASVLHMGCGRGFVLKRFLDWGVGVVAGLDRKEFLKNSVLPEAVKAGDPARPFDLGRQFDLVVCVAGDQTAGTEASNAAIESAARYAQAIVAFCAIPTGENDRATGGGELRSWVECWEAQGFRVLPFPSLAFRLSSNLAPYRTGFLVLARAEQAERFCACDPFGVEDVVRLSPHPATWRPQEPRTYEYTLIGSQLERSFLGAVAIERGGMQSTGKNPLRRFFPRFF